MRRVGVHMYITLDGLNEFPSYPGSGDPPPGEESALSAEMWDKWWESIDTLLFDPTTYEQWAEFWPSSRRTPEEHPWYRRMSEFADGAQKVVLSDRTVPLTWANSRLMVGDVGDSLATLRKEAGKNFAVVAPDLARELCGRGLLDDYLFAVFPVILGKGHPFFGPLPEQRTLRLVECRQFKAGELFLRYETAR